MMGSLLPTHALVIYIMYLLPNCEASKVLLLPLQSKSHLAYFKALGEALAQHGHDVFTVTNAGGFGSGGKSSGTMNTLNYEAPPNMDKDTSEKMDLYHSYSLKDPTGFLSYVHLLDAIFRIPCNFTVTDTTLLNRISGIKFDIAVVDGLFLAHCLTLIPVRFNIPYISMITIHWARLMNVPSLPSFVPAVSPYADRMTFSERLSNLRYALTDNTFLLYRDWSSLTEEVRTMYADLLHTSTAEYSRRSLLWLYNQQTVLDGPRPLTPNIILVGGMTIKPPKLLPQTIQTFLDGATHGVIVVSFGSLGEELPDFINENLIQTFRRLKQRILWRFGNKKGKRLPENVLAIGWIPQRDALAHPKTVLFVTHCGNNGQYEALFGGVPMVGLPLHADQPYNARRIVHRGFGLSLSMNDFTPDDLERAINHVLQNKTIRQNVQKAAKILTDTPETPAERAVYWIEHVIKYGASHLRSYSYELTWYQYWMLDILAFLILIMILVAFVSLVFIRGICRYIFG